MPFSPGSRRALRLQRVHAAHCVWVYWRLHVVPGVVFNCETPSASVSSAAIPTIPLPPRQSYSLPAGYTADFFVSGLDSAAAGAAAKTAAAAPPPTQNKHNVVIAFTVLTVLANLVAVWRAAEAWGAAGGDGASAAAPPSRPSFRTASASAPTAAAAATALVPLAFSAASAVTSLIAWAVFASVVMSDQAYYGSQATSYPCVAAQRERGHVTPPPDSSSPPAPQGRRGGHLRARLRPHAAGVGSQPRRRGGGVEECATTAAAAAGGGGGGGGGGTRGRGRPQGCRSGGRGEALAGPGAALREPGPFQFSAAACHAHCCQCSSDWHSVALS